MNLKKLSLIGILSSSLLASGCATWPMPIKVAATPIAAFRDIADVPLSTLSSGFAYVANNCAMSKKAREEYGVVRACFFGLPIQLAGVVGDIGGVVFGVPDYLVCRSFIGDAGGERPWKEEDKRWRDFWFPNTRELWQDKNKPNYYK